VEKVPERFVDFAAMAATLANRAPGKIAPSPRNKPALIWIVSILALPVAWMILGGLNSHEKSVDDSTPSRHSAVSPSEPITPPPTTLNKPRKIYAMNAGGRIESNHQRTVNNLGNILASHVLTAGNRRNLDIKLYERFSNIRSAFERKDYAGTLQALDDMLAAEEVSSPEPEQILFRALLFKKLKRDREMKGELSKFASTNITSVTPKPALLARLNARLLLLEGLSCFEQGEALVSEVLAIVLSRPEEWQEGTAEKLYHQRARMRVLAGNFAGALADEKLALALPLKYTMAGQSQKFHGDSDAQARQCQINTIVIQWELLEQEFQQYADYLEAEGSPEPLPDLRKLKDEE
jgi:hypothetical protein